MLDAALLLAMAALLWLKGRALRSLLRYVFQPWTPLCAMYRQAVVRTLGYHSAKERHVKMHAELILHSV